jgi:hypothetical protein
VTRGGTGEDRKVFESVAAAGRGALRALWARRDERATLHPTEQRLLELLETHGEYRPFWEGADPGPEENPFLHVVMHEVIDRQVAKDDPPGTREAFERLVNAGVDPHDAQHRILEVFACAMHELMADGRPLDPAAYRARLDALGPGSGADPGDTT